MLANILTRDMNTLREAWGNPTDFRGYEPVNNVFTNASIAFLVDAELIAPVIAGEEFGEESFPNVHEKRYVEAVLDYLAIQGILLTNGHGRYFATEKGIMALQSAEVIHTSVQVYDKIRRCLRTILHFNGHDEERHTLSDIPEAYHVDEALLPVAATFLRELIIPVGENKDKDVASVLSDGNAIAVHDVFPDECTSDARLLMNVLLKAGIIEERDGFYHATDIGKKFLALSGYSEAVVSYYELLQKLHQLMEGTIRYGLDGDIHRDPELNPRGSNHIIQIKVAPYIVHVLDEIYEVSRVFNQKGTFLDYGSGGADCLMQIARSREHKTHRLFGMDINPKTSKTASDLVSSAGLSDQITLCVGSITNAQDLMQVKSLMPPDAGLVASINFILHDIGPESSEVFLRQHAQVFGDSPLIINETFLMPTGVVAANPGYQPASFQFFHKASGQRLFTEQGLKFLLARCGYRIIHEKVHSSIPDEKNDERLNTIMTLVVQWSSWLDANRTCIVGLGKGITSDFGCF